MFTLSESVVVIVVGAETEAGVGSGEGGYNPATDAPDLGTTRLPLGHIILGVSSFMVASFNKGVEKSLLVSV